jgi:predicted acyltransferase (DUF342 family)
MAGNARFHDKIHSTNHHTLSTSGFPDSATDPIASPDKPFKGDFVVNGVLSSSNGIRLLSADIDQELICQDLTVENTAYIDFLSGGGTETIISDGALTGHGNFTLSLDFQTGVYIKTPMTYVTNNLSAKNIIYSNGASLAGSLTGTGIQLSSDATIGGNLTTSGNISATNIKLTGNLDGVTANLSSINLTTDLSARTANLSSLNLKSDLNGLNAYLSSVNLSGNINASTGNLDNLNVTSNTTITGNLLVYGNLSSLGDVSVIETNVLATSSLSVVNSGATAGLLINQLNSNPIANFKTNSVDVATINSSGVLVYGTLSSSGIITSPNITNLQNTSAKWDNASNFVQSSSSIVTSISSSSASWLSGDTNLDFLAKTINVTNLLTSTSAEFTNLNVTSNASITGNLVVYGNLSSLGDVSIIETNIVATSSLSVVNNGNNSGLTIEQNTNYPIAQFKSNTSDIVVISASGIFLNGTLSSSGIITSPNITNLQNASANWDNATTFTQSGSSYVTAISASSGSWLSGNSTVDFLARTVNTLETLSATTLHYHKTLIVPVSSVYSTTDIFLPIDATTYQFISCGNALIVYLPNITINNQGLTFVIKNTSSGNHNITVKNALSSTIDTIAYNANTVRTFISINGNTWQNL